MNKFILTDEKMRNRIIHCANPSVTDKNSYQYLNLDYGVFNTDKQFFITRSYFLSQMMKSNDNKFDALSFVILSVSKDFQINLKGNRDVEYKININEDIMRQTGISENDILDTINYYNSFEKLKFIESDNYKRNVIYHQNLDKWISDNQ